MFKMTIEMNQHKIESMGLTKVQVYEQIHRFMENSDITIVKEGCYEYASDYDITPMVAICSYLSKCFWFTNCVSSWRMFDNEEWTDLIEEWIWN